MNGRKDFIIMVGYPNSGKTTMVKELLKEKDYYVDNFDNAIEEKFRKDTYIENYRCWEELTNEDKEKFKKERDSLLKSAIINNKDIIIDKVNFRDRDKYYKMISEANYNITIFKMERNVDDCFKDQRREGKFIPLSVFKKMEDDYIPVEYDLKPIKNIEW